LQNRENNARQEIRALTDKISHGWIEVNIARSQAGYAERAYELAEQAYRRGAMNFFDFESIRNRLTEARQELLQSELDYKILILDLASSLDIEPGELEGFSTRAGYR
jgi:outer membrane protein TolC